MKGYEVRDTVEGIKCVIEVYLSNEQVIYRLNAGIHVTEEGTYCVPHHLTNSIDRLVEFPEFESTVHKDIRARIRSVMERETIARAQDSTPST